MNTISIVIIVKNGEEFIEKALKSSTWANEIIILDSGSTDNTLGIAKKYTDNIHISDSWPGFGIQRQNAQKLATSDWIFMLDADEAISKELQNAIQDATKGELSVYQVNRLSKAFGIEIKHSGWHPDWINRLYPKNFTTYNDALVHETLIIPKNHLPKKLNGILHHETYQNMKDYYQKMSLYIDAWSTENINKKPNGVLIGYLRGNWAFFKMYIIKLGFLDGRVGFILAILRFETTLMKYVDIKNKRQKIAEK
tara:strand:+ start:1784 stop:2542 length:759 start_codon:yes stop_codon:yes gene_type:complete